MYSVIFLIQVKIILFYEVAETLSQSFSHMVPSINVHNKDTTYYN